MNLLGDISQITLEEMFANIFTVQAITRADRYRMKLAILDNKLTEEHLQALDRLLYAAKRGRLKLID
ncbi:MAG TPA: hypothetical protein IGS52_10270 [Oscillatoriaceae cyanobacterium M33_DOE_052]|uniref:Uncharacterized protein n=1 Tax=Planktothricoides sp. SpSt-374 TaxID=2282167 RepID=A0A7C3VR07_9CYAN|nr:hypothetical protein [Oscillatoriaceae cyanobacterium M33_DOE_052]